MVITISDDLTPTMLGTLAYISVRSSHLKTMVHQQALTIAALQKNQLEF